MKKKQIIDELTVLIEPMKILGGLLAIAGHMLELEIELLGLYL